MEHYYPSYLNLYQSGNLKKRAGQLEEILKNCKLCPRKCKVNRIKNERGFCRSGFLPIVSSFTPHFGEEPVLTGEHGSGTIFLGNCNLKCIYCQNNLISQSGTNVKNEISIDEFASILIKLQNKGCHNINFVSPTHFVPQIVKAIYIAIPMGLKIPVVYNTNSYDSVETLKLLKDIVDIYLPDIKYSNNNKAFKYSGVKDYVEYSRSAIREMWKQTGDITLKNKGITERGVLIRHLILPGNIAGSYDSLKFIAENLSPDTALSIMGQYFPAHKAKLFPGINRTLTEDEYEGVIEILESLGEKNVFVQQLDSHRHYRARFENQKNPFGNS